MFDFAVHIGPQIGDVFAHRESEAARILLAFAEQHRENHEALETELDNCLAAHAWALTAENWLTALSYADIFSHVLDLRGHWTERARMLESSIQAAQSLNNAQALGALANDLGVLFSRSRRMISPAWPRPTTISPSFTQTRASGTRQQPTTSKLWL